MSVKYLKYLTNQLAEQRRQALEKATREKLAEKEKRAEMVNNISQPQKKEKIVEIVKHFSQPPKHGKKKENRADMVKKPFLNPPKEKESGY